MHPQATLVSMRLDEIDLLVDILRVQQIHLHDDGGGLIQTVETSQ